MKKLSYQQVKNYIEKLEYELIDTEYINNSTKLTLKDKNGYLYYTMFNELYKEYNPSIVHISNPYSLDNKNYFIPQMKFNGLVGINNGLLSYDFYIPKYNLLIEYQGEQHDRYIPGLHISKKDFEKQIEHDKRKREYAKNNNIILLEIWYYDYDNIESILQKELNL